MLTAVYQSHGFELARSQTASSGKNGEWSDVPTTPHSPHLGGFDLNVVSSEDRGGSHQPRGVSRRRRSRSRSAASAQHRQRRR